MTQSTTTPPRSNIFVPGGPARYAHQERGLRKLIASKGVGALLFEPGTGKTATTLDLVSVLALTKGRPVRVLVTAPLAAVDTWVSQSMTYVADGIDVWAEALGGSLVQRAEAIAARGGRPFRKVTGSQPRGIADDAIHTHRSLLWDARRAGIVASGTRDGGLGGRIALQGVGHTLAPREGLRGAVTLLSVNLDTFGRRDAHGSGTIADHLLEAVKRFEPDLIVVDESHRIKSPSSNVSRMLARLAPLAPHRVILTGTVMPHSPLDVFAQWRFLDPYAFGQKDARGERSRATFERFRNRYAIMGGFMGREVTGFKNLPHLQSTMEERAAVATKANSLDLPPTTDVIVPVHLSPAEERAYAEMKATLAAQFPTTGAARDDDGASTSTAVNRLAQMMRLRQITSGHLPADDGSVREVGDSKVRTISSLVHDTLVGEKRIVVFCMFTHEIRALRDALAKSGTEVLVIDGSTPKDERLAIRRRFGDKTTTERLVLVAQIKTISLAVNELVSASHAIFGSLSLQRDDLVQARDRLNRIGQDKPCTFWWALAPGTVDQVIHSTYLDRSDLEAAILAHIHGEAPAQSTPAA